jgi:hypothetical protein
VTTAYEPSGGILAWDASALHHAGSIGRLDVLGDLAEGPKQAPWRNVTTAAVVEELSSYGLAPPQWVEVVHVDGLSELIAVAPLGRAPVKQSAQPR